MCTLISAEMAKTGIPPTVVNTRNLLTLKNIIHQWEIVGAHLDVTAHTTNHDPNRFDDTGEAARDSCAISNALKFDFKRESRLIWYLAPALRYLLRARRSGSDVAPARNLN